ncbi:DNA cytosine methyltransferase [Cocleimonas flava]|uniref:DNA cytosine methyltransferase n=1 Tax=Cocleimonas flava TaxID=634765 RepID=UPI001FB2846E|nr:DNA cytosine methyltransferase [Cocleimonas flava]
MSYKVLDIFSGCGGLSLGLEQAGFEIVLGIDNWQDALNTFKKNHINSETYCHDLSKIDYNHIEKNYLKDGIDVIVGGPPCQGFSISGKRDPSDPRNKLYTSFVKSVKHFKPKAFVMENVPNLASMQQGRIKDIITSEFESLGYSIKSERLLTSDYGVPQNRKRFIMVGLLNDTEFSFPAKTHFENKITTEQAISDLPENSVVCGAGYLSKPLSNYQKHIRGKSKGIFNHVITNHTEKTTSIISLVPDGGNYKDLPNKYKNTRNVNIAWTRFNSKKPSLTIDTGHRHHFHYKYNRVPTVRESARLQSFPDDFIFLGSKTSQYKQVGNAVPPILSKSLGLALLNNLG